MVRIAPETETTPFLCANAPTQWHCPDCGVISIGFAFPYGRCPHCGGQMALLHEPRRLGPDQAAQHAVRLAFEIELGGRAFYQRAAAETTDDTLRLLFSQFALMEGEHMETLSDRYRVDVPVPSPGFRIELAALFAHVEHRPQDPDNLFRIAIALEERAAAFFRMRAAVAPAGSSEQQLYLELGAEEIEHADILTTAYQEWRARQPAAEAPPAQEVAPAVGPAPLNGAELLLAQGEADQVALVCGDQQLTYAQLRDRVARAAGAWKARGLRPGDRVAVKLPDGIDWVVAFLGTIWAGGVAVAVNPHVPAAEWNYILDEAGFAIILAEHADDTPAPWGGRVIQLEPGRHEVTAAEPVRAHRVDDDTPAFWCHSSGTSGKPKAVVHRHRFAREIERVSCERLGITAQDRLFATSRLFFSYPQTNSLFAGLKIGATVILDPQWPTAASAAAIVERQRPTVFFSVPSLYRNLLHAGLAPAIVAAGVRLCVSAGEMLPASLRDAWRKATGLEMIDGYGASETLVLVLTARGDDDGLQPSPGVEVHPLDPEAAAAGMPTRLSFHVSTLARGYLDRPAAQAQSFRGDAFCPADLFVPTRGGGWRFAGREDSLVKIRGRWVNLVELEEKLAAGVPGVLEAATVCVPDEDGVDSVVLFFAARPGEAARAEEGLRARAASLRPHERPRSFHDVPALPRTATGKLLRRKLADAFVNGVAAA
ncbi:class I adenylate-forming enzyme family protein [Ramlibacter alkalitolerans]|uniref:AMP-binding protein n=1 Tax=Ramlibacter alkalitolerans TaxID=2039631 RepID=A0ABS1JTS4_9BURK|nr:AMP-binding protein [Ramlibacter alkalitolerans]MBL0427618.1 AMP-binding protein [Ramlibacter alkalitolerans]